MPLLERSTKISEAEGNQMDLEHILENLTYALRESGRLREAEQAARRALIIARETQSHSEADIWSCRPIAGYADDRQCLSD